MEKARELESHTARQDAIRLASARKEIQLAKDWHRNWGFLVKNKNGEET